MKEEKLPARYFAKGRDKFSDNIIWQNREEGVAVSETRIRYKGRFLHVWEVNVEFLEILRKNEVSIPGFHFKTYAEINDRIQVWRLLDFRKEVKVAKVRKVLKEIGQRKIEAKRQAPTE